MGLEGMRILSLESRRTAEMRTLIANQGGAAFVAPSMREAELPDHREAFDFAQRLFAGDFELVALLTGVGTRALDKAIAERYGGGRLAEGLRTVTVAVRGPKPLAVLREMNVRAAIVAPKPNTWRELLAALEGRPEKRIAVQEYGRPNEELLAGLRARGAEVTPVRVYHWDLPADTGPLREAAGGLLRGEFDCVLFTTAIQIVHLLRVAADTGSEEGVKAGLRGTVIASIGPTTSEALEDAGIPPDIEATQGKMGILVKEAAEQARLLLTRKRTVS